MTQTFIPWSKAGLDDPRVKQCYDRGNDFFDADVPMPNRPRSNPRSYTNQNWKDLTMTLSTELWSSVENPEWGGAMANFLPRQQFRRIVTPERVRVIIAGLEPFNNRYLDTFVHAAFSGGNCDGVHRRPSVKLLAALICCGAVDHYLDLVYRGVSDVCLPPAFEKNRIANPLKCQSRKCNTEHTFLGNISTRDRKEFYAWTYYLNAPYLTRPKPPKSSKPTQRLHHHYILTNDDVLPIMSSVVQDPGSSTSRTRQTGGAKSSESQGTQDGGFSTVTRVEFHPDHYDFGTQNGEKYKVFALKKLNASDQTSFSHELASLLTFITDDNEHLVKLLASFEIRSYRTQRTNYYLLFPWADGTLWDFWKLNDAVDRRTNLSQWMSEQCYRLAKALQVFHNERKNQLRNPDFEQEKKELYGRHGDIKAENILWFERQSRLVLNDFGLARLHSKISRSAQDPNAMGRTETYRAPEFDLPDSKITRTSDIFSLGCAFLEFATWFVEGFHSVDVDFVDARSERDPRTPEYTLDTFFKIEEVHGKKVSVIKPQVKLWIERLRKHRNCTQFILDFLDLIERHMLDPNPKKRFPSGRVVKELWTLREACHKDTTYWKDPVNR
ncbi:kinase-like domain-containing protein [Apiospora phragmitis]|uniref:Kinase-like domain-containing protein n=1 Tax=Apiospora phragmitis TaxID=2905665 RepID=A0ABR1T8W7_9PEZI